VSHIRWTEQAVTDLQAIRDYIARDSPRYGHLVAERLFEATQRLEDFPLLGRMVPELGLDDIREIIVGEYRIVYRMQRKIATILTIFRSSRLLPSDLTEAE